MHCGKSEELRALGRAAAAVVPGVARKRRDGVHTTRLDGRLEISIDIEKCLPWSVRRRHDADGKMAPVRLFGARLVRPDRVVLCK